MAFKRSFSLQDLKNKNYKKVSEKNVSTTIIDGQPIASGETAKVKTANALQHLNRNNSTTSLNRTASELDRAVDMLETIGCCVVDMGTDFSLINTQTDKEGIENPNIIDTEALKNKKNKQTMATDKFSNPADPFYQLDGGPPRRTQLQNESIKSNKYENQTVTLGADLAALNLSAAGTTLKYFK